MEQFHLVLVVVAIVATVAAAVLVPIWRRRHDAAAPPSTSGALAGMFSGMALGLWILVPVFRRWPALAGEPLTIAFTVVLVINLGVLFLLKRAQRREKVRRREPRFPLALLWGTLLAVMAARSAAIFTLD